MKKLLPILLIPSLTLAGCGAMIQTTVYDQPQAYAGTNNDVPTDQVFYDELSPYGTWIDYPDYGYVWVPDAGPDFRPYATNGYWVYSDYGWTWVSNYSWGWAPFHYGRWFHDDYYGWMWQPGSEWAPAWVTWGGYGDYYCWAPIAPHVSTSVAFGGGWTPPAYSWNVVPGRNMTHSNVGNYIERNNSLVVNHITVINNVNNYNNGRPNGNSASTRVVYNRGPQIGDVENVTHNRIQPVRVTSNSSPGVQVMANNQLSVYRPAIQVNATGNNRPAPKRVESYRHGNNPNSQKTNYPQQQQPGQQQYGRQDQNQQQYGKQDQNQNPKSNYPQPQQPNQQPYGRQDQNQQQSGQQQYGRQDQNQNPKPNYPQQQQQQPGQQQPTRQDQGQNPKPNYPQQQQTGQQQPARQDQNQNPKPNYPQQQQQQPGQQQPARQDQNQNPKPNYPQQHSNSPASSSQQGRIRTRILSQTILSSNNSPASSSQQGRIRTSILSQTILSSSSNSPASNSQQGRIRTSILSQTILSSSSNSPASSSQQGRIRDRIKTKSQIRRKDRTAIRILVKIPVCGQITKMQYPDLTPICLTISATTREKKIPATEEHRRL